MKDFVSIRADDAYLVEEIYSASSQCLIVWWERIPFYRPGVPTFFLPCTPSACNRLACTPSAFQQNNMYP